MRALPFVVFLLFAPLARADSPPSPVEEADPDVKIDAGRLAVEFGLGAVGAGTGAAAVGAFILMAWFGEMFVTASPEPLQFVGVPLLLGASLGAGAGVYGGARFFSDRGSVWAALAGGLVGGLPAVIYAGLVGSMDAPQQWLVLAGGGVLAVIGAMIGYEISHALIAPWYAPRAVAPFRLRDAYGLAAAWTF